MRNILILAYQLSPTKGSEYSVAWNYVKRMSKYNHLTVLYGVSGDHLGDTEEMEQYASEIGIKNVEFIVVKPDKITNMLNWCNRHNILSYSFYFAYHSWHKQVFHVAQGLIENRQYDLIHFVGPIGYREPGYLWQLNIPYLWGPIGGANNASMILLQHSSISTKIKYHIRNHLNKIQLLFNQNLKKVLEHTDLLLTSTTENQQIFVDRFHKQSFYLAENSIDNIRGLTLSKFNTDKRYHFIVVGRIDAGKCLNILLEALCLIKNRDKYILDIVGDGPDKQRLEIFAKKNGLCNIVWHGFLPRKSAVELFDHAHLHIVTSAKEGNPTTIWEAMSYGVPTISFDHCGMHDTVTKESGIRIPITSYTQCVRDLATHLDNLLENPILFKKLAEGTIKCAQQYTWEQRELFLLNCYDIAIRNHSVK